MTQNTHITTFIEIRRKKSRILTFDSNKTELTKVMSVGLEHHCDMWTDKLTTNS